jgi:hypothetical protein
MKTNGEWMYSFTILDLVDGGSGQLHAPSALAPWKEALGRVLGGPQSRSGLRREGKNPLPLPGIEH